MGGTDGQTDGRPTVSYRPRSAYRRTMSARWHSVECISSPRHGVVTLSLMKFDGSILINCVPVFLSSALEKLFTYLRPHSTSRTSVGFVAAAVTMPMGGCRAIRPVVDVSVVAVDVVIAVRLAVL